jgi:ribosomal protein S18 acetylase RimI-like enzyme
VQGARELRILASIAERQTLKRKAQVVMPTYRLQLEKEPAPADVGFLLEGLYQYNVEQTGRDDGEWLAVFTRDETNRIVAGLHGWTWAGWLKISFLWVSPNERSNGRGRELLLTAETEARRRGCSSATLDTYSFQAPDFYRKLGYRIVATVEGLPEGHRRHTLVKDLRQ